MKKKKLRLRQGVKNILILGSFYLTIILGILILTARAAQLG